jgi:hypothetical protein
MKPDSFYPLSKKKVLLPIGILLAPVSAAGGSLATSAKDGFFS